MEDSPDMRGPIYRHRKPIAVIVIMFIVFQLAIIIPNLNDESDTEVVISHSLTVWILPLEEEFDLYLNFYSSEQDAAERVNSWAGVSMRVMPLANEEHTIYLSNMPENLVSVWMKICFDRHEGEPFVVFGISLGQKTTTTLLSREISILMQPY